MKYYLNFLTLFAFTMLSCSKSDLWKAPKSESLNKSVWRSYVTSSSLHNWMSALNDTLLLSQLTIPGSHNAGAAYESLPGVAKCQNLSIREQLNIGTRFIDVRCRHYHNTFEIHHGIEYQRINFDDVLNACWAFLSNNPNECIVISLKEEYSPNGNTRSFEQTFDSYVSKNVGGWYLKESVPSIKDARGKIILLRRFAATTPKGISLSGWADNTTFSINNGTSQFRIQDNYKVNNTDLKWRNIRSLIEESKYGNLATVYINFTSGYKPGFFGIPNIPVISNNINQRLKAYFSATEKGRYGIIAMDFSNVELNAMIIKTNF